MPYLSQRDDGTVLLAVHVQPRASRNALLGIHDQALKLAITAPPVDSKANKAVIALLASCCKIAKNRIVLQSGHQSRRKKLVIEGALLQDLRERIELALATE